MKTAPNIVLATLKFCGVSMQKIEEVSSKKTKHAESSIVELIEPIYSYLEIRYEVKAAKLDNMMFDSVCSTIRCVWHQI